MITITMRKCERADITNAILARTKLYVVETQIVTTAAAGEIWFKFMIISYKYIQFVVLSYKQ